MIGITDGGVLVPAEHGVDGLLQLDGVGLIDAARIDPDMQVTISSRLLAASSDLSWPTSRVLVSVSNDILEGQLLMIFPPCVRQYGVRRHGLMEEVLERERVYVEETHGRGCENPTGSRRVEPCNSALSS